MLRTAAVAAFCTALLCAGAAQAREDDGVEVPCASAPAGAVMQVPAPFDQFMSVACTRSGHALRPPKGYSWVFDEGPMWLTALNPASAEVSPDAHFTALEVAPLNERELAAYRRDLATITTHPELATAEVLRLRVSTSTGARKQIYYLVQRDGAGAVARAWGMECTNDCKPLRKDAWPFTVVPAG